MTGMDKPADKSGPIPRWRQRLKEQIGEDPGRFLCSELVENGASHTTETNQMLARARIRGIDSVATARAWLAAERRIGPRETVVEWIKHRIEWLDENGDRRDRLDYDSIPSRDERVDERGAEFYEDMSAPATKTTCEVLWGTPAEQMAAKKRTEGHEAADVLDSLPDDLDGEKAVATDGGRDE